MPFVNRITWHVAYYTMQEIICQQENEKNIFAESFCGPSGDCEKEVRFLDKTALVVVLCSLWNDWDEEKTR